VRIVPDPAVIRHDSARSYMDIRAEVAGRSLDAVGGEIEQRVRGVAFPLEYHAEVLGTYAQRKLTQTQLLALAAAALLGIYLLLHAALGSWRLAALTLATLAAALSGGVLVSVASGFSLSLGAALALLGVLGLAVRAILVQLHRYQQMERAAGHAFRLEVVRLGAHDQVPPLLATTLASALALAAFAMPGDLPGLEIVRAMAGVALGALLTSTLVCLFVLPSLYLRFGTSPAPEEASLAHSRPSMPLSAAGGQVPAGAGAD
jgi:Cu/Ag efflux pump CusA